MSATAFPATSKNCVTCSEVEAVDRALIDTAMRVPVMFFYTFALKWLLAATLFGVIASIKMHAPDFLGSWNFLTYGRVWPAFTNTLVYGWGVQVALGTGLWLMARLCRAVWRSSMPLIVAGVFWNFGIFIGVLSILCGKMQPFDLLEFPHAAVVLLFVSYVLIAAWVVLLFLKGRPEKPFVTTWYLLGAFLWFPWLYGAANVMLANAHGVEQAIVAAWYAQSLLILFFSIIGLGTILYLIPKVLGRPIYSFSLAVLGFWTHALFGGWMGLTRLTGGPVPAWLPTISIAGTILMLIPLLAVATNLARTMVGRTAMIYYSPPIRFATAGALAWALFIGLSVVVALRNADRITHFTQFAIGQFQLLVYGSFSMAMFGAMYYIIPRLVGCEWLSVTLIRLHFWGSVYGMGLIVFVLLVGGVAEGVAWLDPELSPALVAGFFQPYMIGRTLGWAMLIISHALFGLHFVAMLFRLGEPSGEPALFAPLEEGERLV